MAKIAELRSAARKELLKLAEDSTSGLDSQTLSLDIDLLLMQALSLNNRAELFLKEDCPADSEKLFRTYLKRRLASEPIAYICGQREFRNLTFEVSPAVLIPRPETELIVEKAHDYLSEDSTNFSVYDIGTGSGAIILSLMHELKEKYGESYVKKGHFLASDLSEEALTVAKKNAKRFSLEPEFETSDVFSKLHINSDFSLILANPPYIAPSETLQKNVLDHEPHNALFAAEEGLEIIRRIIEGLSSFRDKAFVLIMEVGDKQRASVESLLRKNGFDKFYWLRDLAGIDRTVVVENCG